MSNARREAKRANRITLKKLSLQDGDIVVMRGRNCGDVAMRLHGDKNCQIVCLYGDQDIWKLPEREARRLYESLNKQFGGPPISPIDKS